MGAMTEPRRVRPERRVGRIFIGWFLWYEYNITGLEGFV
jgi:hypothetical protein